jgi:hypothetical protein
MIEATINIQTTQIRRSIRSQVRKDLSPVYRFPRAHPTEAERAAEKGHFWGRISPRVAGAKAPFSHFKQLMARLKPPQRRRPVAGDPGKSCPFAHLLPSWSFSAACEAQFFLASCGPAEQAAEKGLVLGETRQKHTSGAEALVDLIGFMPGINPRPTARTSFSASCEVVPFQN